MNITLLKVKNGNITLPRNLRRPWTNADVFVSVSNDMISIKKLSKPDLTLTEMAKAFQRGAREANLTKKDVQEAIKDARRQLYS